MLSMVQRIDLTEIVSDRTRVVSNNIDHYCNSFRVSSVNKVFEILLTSEVRVDLFPVSGPVAMVSWLNVVNNR